MRQSDMDEPKEVDMTKPLDELEWYKLMEDIREITPQSDFMEKVKRKTKENPLVPVGALATVMCLTMGLRSMFRGSSSSQQFYMRGRVIAQAFTIATCVYGMYFMGFKERNKRAEKEKKKQKEQQNIKQ